jgi:hypothetical protein
VSHRLQASRFRDRHPPSPAQQPRPELGTGEGAQRDGRALPEGDERQRVVGAVQRVGGGADASQAFKPAGRQDDLDRTLVNQRRGDESGL